MMQIFRIISQYSAVPAGLFAEVGLSMFNFIGTFASQRSTRMHIAKNSKPMLLGLLNEIYEKCRITHRDIRPANIVMKPKE
jgi:serine/threonine protein kinase